MTIAHAATKTVLMSRMTASTLQIMTLEDQMKRKVMAEMHSSLIQKWKMIGYKRVFPHVFFSWRAVQFPFLYLLHWIQLFMFMSFACCTYCCHVLKTFFYQYNKTWIFFYFSISKPKVHQPTTCFHSFLLCSISDVQTRCRSSSKD